MSTKSKWAVAALCLVTALAWTPGSRELTPQPLTAPARVLGSPSGWLSRPPSSNTLDNYHIIPSRAEQVSAGLSAGIPALPLLGARQPRLVAKQISATTPHPARSARHPLPWGEGLGLMGYLRAGGGAASNAPTAIDATTTGLNHPATDATWVQRPILIISPAPERSWPQTGMRLARQVYFQNDLAYALPHARPQAASEAATDSPRTLRPHLRTGGEATSLGFRQLAELATIGARTAYASFPHLAKAKTREAAWAPTEALQPPAAVLTAGAPKLDLKRAVAVNLALPGPASSLRLGPVMAANGALGRMAAPPLSSPSPAFAADDVPPSFPQGQRAAQAARVLASSTANVNPEETALITPPGFHQVSPRYTGKLISLDLRAVDIRDFFRLIHEVSGLNIIVDSNIAGKITLVLDDVPWDQALDLVLKNNGLGKILEGNVLRIAKIRTLAAEAEQIQELRQAKLKSEPLITLVRRLRYAYAEDQQPNMSSGGMSGIGGMGGMGGGSGGMQLKPIPGVVSILKSTKGVLSPRGSVVADPRDNAVIVTDVPSQMPVIESFVDKLDTKSKQVSIQVRVVLASNVFARTLSSALSGSYHNKSGSTHSVGGTGAGSAANTTLSAPTLASTATTAGFGTFAITNAGARYIINAAITAGEEHDQARTLSRPTIVTQNNFPGLVMQGVQIPVQTSVNLTVTTQYINAALELTVTPQVTVDNRVFLDIYVNNASPGTISSNGNISINVQEATTKVLVPDGGTVVFGGITVTQRSRSANYLPLLGSIPVIGNLFKSSAVNDQNQELLFFVSPTILSD